MFRRLTTSLFATAAAAAAAPALGQSQGFTSTTSGTILYSTSQQRVPRDDDSVRLILQWAADQGGMFSSYPIEIGNAVWAAESAGWLKSSSPPSIQTKDKDGNDITYSTGFISWELTESGRAELTNRNARLGSAATRMAHSTRFVPGAGVVVYGGARRVPLTSPMRVQDGSPIVDR